jgi:corrinoid protein of di/trimethylamine methyltransferase
MLLSDAIVEMDDIKSAEIAQRIVDNNLNVVDAIERGLVKGMERAGSLFDQEEYFITEILMCADCMDIAMKILMPHIKKGEKKSKGRIVIGTIFGDTHDIGKNIVSLFIQSAGYDVLDLGRDVAARRFVDSAVEFKADIIAVSTLMTTTMDNIVEVTRILIKEGIRDKFKVMVGGRPLSESFARKIGADLYASNAGSALRLIKKVLY